MKELCWTDTGTHTAAVNKRGFYKSFKTANLIPSYILIPIVSLIFLNIKRKVFFFKACSGQSSEGLLATLFLPAIEL